MYEFFAFTCRILAVGVYLKKRKDNTAIIIMQDFNRQICCYFTVITSLLAIASSVNS